jgi:hypothetical protein
LCILSTYISCDRSSVFIQKGVEYELECEPTGSSLSLRDGNQVQVTHNSNGYTTIVTKGEMTVSERVAIIGSSAKTNVTFSLIKIEDLSLK